MSNSTPYPVRNLAWRPLRSFRRLLPFLLLTILPGAFAHGQYFGRNKVQYESFDFRVLKTEHFDIYFYPQEEVAVRDAARMAERWYQRLSTIFRHDFTQRKPIVLYADQGDFQQTNTISGSIGEGTGGVTESLKNRVILPFTGTYEENDHVLGHELVHAFQYDIALTPGGQGERGMGQLPLWFIEGMAEYLSIGRTDPNSAMWLRDVVLRDDIPTIDDLAGNPRYFPYRFGQALWAYIGGRFGDDKVATLYKSGLSLGLEGAIQRTLGLSVDSLSAQWAADLRATYAPLTTGRTRPETLGTRLLSEDEEDNLNVAPSISPNGDYVAFLSTRGLFSIDLYLADARTGEVIKELFSAESDGHFDAIRFINSAGSWSPDGRKFAFVVYSEGNDEIAILDVASRSIEQRIRLKGIGGISNPAWSPDGSRIAFSGIAGGLSDIYLVDIRTGQTRRLTNDRYADMQPMWSPDGRTIAMASDRGTQTDFSGLTYAPLELTLLDVDAGTTRQIKVFAGADHINPQYSPDGRDLYFISNYEGFNDVYRYSFTENRIYRITNVATGVSGIAATSPAMSVASRTGRIVFSVFNNGSNVIRALDPAQAVGTAVTDAGTGRAPGGLLPPTAPSGTSAVDRYLADAVTGLPSGMDFEVQPYSAALQLDYIGAPMFGVSTSETFGTSLGGAISAYFSDLLGNHHVGVSVQANAVLGGGASLGDVGAEAFYLNQKNRWNWGATVSHIPYVSSQIYTRSVDITIDSQDVQAVEVRQDFQRVYVNGGSLLALYPFSTTQRFEAEAGYRHYGYSITSNYQYFVGNQMIRELEKEAPTPDGLDLFQSSLALVGDNSFFGFTSPVRGTRYRLEAGVTTGSLTFGTALADFRHYIFVNPLTVAMRAYHYGRYGADGESDRITPLFLGYPTYVHGYESATYDLSECTGGGVDGVCPEFDRLLGSRMAVANLELRLPVFGTSEFGLINFPYLPLELAAFFDAGVAWTGTQSPVFKLERETHERVPVMSTGLAARANVLGYFVLELSYAYPFQRPQKGWQFGFQISPGW